MHEGEGGLAFVQNLLSGKSALNTALVYSGQQRLEVPVIHLLALGAELGSQHKDSQEVSEPMQDCVTKATF